MTYSYNHMNEMVERTVDSNADETVDARRVFVHEGGQIVLHFEETGSGELAGGDLARRYVWNPSSVDALLADEAYDGTQTAEDVLWALCDHLGTVRDLVRFATSTKTVSVANHITYDSFGNLVSETSTYDTDDSLFHYTGKIYDTLISLQWNLNRWYDPSTGRWMSTDPIGFEAGDVNVYRYVGNHCTRMIDSLGLQCSICCVETVRIKDSISEGKVSEQPAPGIPKWIVTHYGHSFVVEVQMKYYANDDYASPCGLYWGEYSKDFGNVNTLGYDYKNGQWNNPYATWDISSISSEEMVAKGLERPGLFPFLWQNYKHVTGQQSASAEGTLATLELWDVPSLQDNDVYTAFGKTLFMKPHTQKRHVSFFISVESGDTKFCKNSSLSVVAHQYLVMKNGIFDEDASYFVHGEDARMDAAWPGHPEELDHVRFPAKFDIFKSIENLSKTENEC